MPADLISALGIGLSVVGLPASIQEPAVEPAELAPSVVTIAEGAGLAATLGDRVTVHFVVRTLEGKVLADSVKRGMPFTVELGLGDPFWLAAIDGMKADGRRRVRANTSQFFPHGVAPIVGSDTWIEADLTLLKVQKSTSARRSDSGVKSGQR